MQRRSFVHVRQKKISYCGIFTQRKEKQACSGHLKKLFYQLKHMIIDMSPAGLPDHMDFKQLLSSAVRFSDVIYRAMLTVDFLPAIKVA